MHEGRWVPLQTDSRAALPKLPSSARVSVLWEAKFSEYSNRNFNVYNYKIGTNIMTVNRLEKSQESRQGVEY